MVETNLGNITWEELRSKMEDILDAKHGNGNWKNDEYIRSLDPERFPSTSRHTNTYIYKLVLDYFVNSKPRKIRQDTLIELADFFDIDIPEIEKIRQSLRAKLHRAERTMIRTADDRESSPHYAAPTKSNETLFEFWSKSTKDQFVILQDLVTKETQHKSSFLGELSSIFISAASESKDNDVRIYCAAFAALMSTILDTSNYNDASRIGHYIRLLLLEIALRILWIMYNAELENDHTNRILKRNLLRDFERNIHLVAAAVDSMGFTIAKETSREKTLREALQNDNLVNALERHSVRGSSAIGLRLYPALNKLPARIKFAILYLMRAIIVDQLMDNWNLLIEETRQTIIVLVNSDQATKMLLQHYPVLDLSAVFELRRLVQKRITLLAGELASTSITFCKSND